MTQRKDILRYMRERGSITPLEALQHFGCLRLAARILELREESHDIETDAGRSRGKTFARYSLKPQPRQGGLFEPPGA